MGAIGIESQWEPPDLDQVPEDLLFVRILSDRDDLNLGAAFRTNERMDLLHLCEKPRPGALAGVKVDFFFAIP